MDEEDEEVDEEDDVEEMDDEEDNSDDPEEEDKEEELLVANEHALTNANSAKRSGIFPGLLKERFKRSCSVFIFFSVLQTINV